MGNCPLNIACLIKQTNSIAWTMVAKCSSPHSSHGCLSVCLSVPPPDARLSQIGDSDLPMHVHLLSLLENPAAVVTAAAAGDMDTLRNFLRKKPDAVSELVL